MFVSLNLLGSGMNGEEKKGSLFVSHSLKINYHSTRTIPSSNKDESPMKYDKTKYWFRKAVTPPQNVFLLFYSTHQQPMIMHFLRSCKQEGDRSYNYLVISILTLKILQNLTVLDRPHRFISVKRIFCYKILLEICPCVT